MADTKTRIAAGLEQAFAQHGFAEPNIDILREAAGVSLRTLYKYMPSREEMVLSALEHRHRRYMQLVIADLPENEEGEVLSEILDRVSEWMSTEAAHGCLFHAAVAAAPRDARLRALLERHKREVAQRIAALSGLSDCEGEITLIIEGLMQNWPLHGSKATASAKRLGELLLSGNRPSLKSA
ncbi:MAG: TetR/AcrR family transcriptional regulator [Roseibium sp.]|uniref:TetR/AcrR family transcriptional regulator n=1 Tax=Roseibium sp. TaxID=1936156 RepID=UPI002632C52C|nr:TetR/AcrR family transcriptional regulator [Roseibium sp.]MCV0429880.1 TetR/AcrR family transcriptional regulator [Roseibium sp.]